MDDRQFIADLLSALEYHTEQTRPIEFSKVAIEAAREYLRKPEQPAQQEPVAYLCEPDENGLYGLPLTEKTCTKCFPVYRHPQRTWVGLTDEELSEVYNQADWDTVSGWEYERAIEAKLKERNL